MRRVRALGPVPRALALLLLVALGDGGPAQAEEQAALPMPRALSESAEFLRAQWLPRRQRADGSWSSRDWDLTDLGRPVPPRARLPGRATANHDLTCTALATAAMLSSGYTDFGDHPLADVVGRSIGWLLDRQRPSGAFVWEGEAAPRHASAHAALPVIEHYGMTQSTRTRAPAKRAVRGLLATQGPDGAWTTAGRPDALHTLWACMALQSAQLIDRQRASQEREPVFGPDVPAAIARAAAWFARRTDPVSGVVGVHAGDAVGDGATVEVRTAAGALLRVWMPRDDGMQPPELAKGEGWDAPFERACAWLASRMPTSAPELATSDALYWWLGTLALYQHGSTPWARWKKALETHVLDAQHKLGDAGALRKSWAPRGAWGGSRGRVAMTATAFMAMTMFYHYDRVFGAATDDLIAAQGRLRTMYTPTTGPLAWRRSGQPIHAARFQLAEGGALPMDAVHVRAAVHGLRAQVVLDFYLTNTTKEQQEGLLDLRLPDGATPYYLAFGEAVLAKVPDPSSSVGFATDIASLRHRDRGTWGEVREARMAPVRRATEAFETIVQARKDPALLTWQGAGMYHLRVFPLLPGTQHRVIVAYDVDLSLVESEAELRLGVPAGIPEVRIALDAPAARVDVKPNVATSDGVRVWRNPAAKQILARIDASGDHWIQGADARGAMHTAGWVHPEVPKLPRNVSAQAVFLIDVSQSVRPDQMQAWRTLVPAILTAHRDRIRTFRVGFFDMSTRWWRGDAVANTPEALTALGEALDVLEPGGATDLAAAFRSLPATTEPTDVFLFTDGLPTWGETLRRAVTAAVPAKHAVFPYAVGIGAEDRRMLGAIAAESEGALVTVLGPADLHAAARAPQFQAWELAAVAVEGVSDLLVSGEPRRVQPGQRLRLGGRGAPADGATLFLRLRRGTREHVVRTPIAGMRTTPGAWRVYGTEGVQRLEMAGDAQSELALDYAMHYRVVRKSCALLMLETQAMYKRFGLDSKGHGARAAQMPVIKALGQASTDAEDAPPLSLVAYARARRVPASLVRGLAPQGEPLPQGRLPSDEVLRELGGRLESAPGRTERQAIAAHLLALGRPGHAAMVLRTQPAAPRGGATPAMDWLLARAAVSAQRPQLALVAFEAALGEHDEAGGVASWVIAADYERFLRSVTERDLPEPVLAFARMRLASLERWRVLVGHVALPRQADLVVLHMPTHQQDFTRLCFVGASAAAARRFAVGSGQHSPQALVVAQIPPGESKVRLERPRGEPSRGAHWRSLVLVVRDWGRPNESLEVRRSIGTTDDAVVYRVGGR